MWLKPLQGDDVDKITAALNTSVYNANEPLVLFFLRSETIEAFTLTYCWHCLLFKP